MSEHIIPNAQKVSTLLKACLFNPDTDVTIGVVPVEGITREFIFDVGRLEENRAAILEQIDALPWEFANGWSFLNACINKNGDQWGEHYNVEELMVLGIAIDKIEICLPKQFWAILPGGVPYFQVK